MNAKENLLKKFWSIFPYLIIILGSFLSTYILFRGGLPGGDDIVFHLSQIEDLIYGFKHGYWGLTTNHLFFGSLALNNYAFYGPLPHYLAAIIGFLTEWRGGSAIFGYKVVIFLAGIMGGIYFYLMSLKISKSKALSMIASIIFVFTPYRLFCAICRAAFSEAVAMCFIPVVFYGAVSVIHNEKYQVSPYIALILGAFGVILSHPFTGLLTAVFGVLYFVFNIKHFIKNRKNWMMWISLGVSLILIVCLVGFYVFPAMQFKKLSIYQFNDAVKCWTTYEHVSGDTARSVQYSGFINWKYVAQMSGVAEWKNDTESLLIFSIFIYFISLVIMMVVDHFVKPLKHSKYYRYAADILPVLVIQLIIFFRVEVFFASVVCFFGYIAINKLMDNNIDSEKTRFLFIKSFDFYFLIFSLIVCFSLIFIPTSWLNVPKAFYNAQFPWRVWSIAFFFISMLVVVVFSEFKADKRVLSTLLVLGCSLLTMSQALIEKRNNYYKEGSKVYVDAYETALKATGSGAQNEGCPQIFFDGEYEPSYPNSLYYTLTYLYYNNSKLYRYIDTSEAFAHDVDSYVTPVILEGSGSISVKELNTPSVTLSVKIDTDNALVQLSQIYYDGYVAKEGKKTIAEGINVDGFVAFNLHQGEYQVTVKFINTKTYRITRPFFYVGCVLIAPLAVVGYKINKRKETQEPKVLEKK